MSGSGCTLTAVHDPESAHREEVMYEEFTRFRGGNGLSPWGAASVCIFILGSAAALGQNSQAPTFTTVLSKCQQCHGETVQMSNLNLASRAGMLKGGDHGPAIVPGNATGSLLYQRITGQAQPTMPMAPLPKLTVDEIRAVKDWIDAGAQMVDGQKPELTSSSQSSL